MGGKSMGKSKIVRESILDRWSITPDELTIAIDENPSLRGMLLGYVAEYKLRSMWFAGRSDITLHVKHDDHDRKKKGDLIVIYRERSSIIESKSLQTHSIRREGDAWIGKAIFLAQPTRNIRPSSKRSCLPLWFPSVGLPNRRSPTNRTR